MLRCSLADHPQRLVGRWKIVTVNPGPNNSCVRTSLHIRPMHVSSRDSPQSLEFWEDGRRSGSNYFVGSGLAKQREKMGRVVSF
jgi:hypothetical protein